MKHPGIYHRFVRLNYSEAPSRFALSPVHNLCAGVEVCVCVCVCVCVVFSLVRSRCVCMCVYVCVSARARVGVCLRVFGLLSARGSVGYIACVCI